MNGCVLLIDKVAGPTSHDVVQTLRRVLGERKIGHAGTLDPFATGLLVCCVGPATRLAAYLTDGDKQYVGRVRLGMATDTLDLTGKVVERLPVPGDWRQRLPAATAALSGRRQQVPPMTSAVKVGGRRLYQLARAGIEVERQPRTISIERLTADPAGPDEIDIAVSCSKGTYIRVLAAELGRALGTCATLAELRRLRVGALEVADAVRSDRLAELGRDDLLRAAAVTPAAALDDWAAITLDGTASARVRHGVAPARPAVLEVTRPVLAGERVRLLDEAGELLALVESLVDLPPIGGEITNGGPGATASGTPREAPGSVPPDECERIVARFLCVLGGSGQG